MHPSPRTCAPTWQLVWFGRFMLQVESVRPLSWVGGYWATGGLSVFLPPVLGSRGSTTLFYLFFIYRACYRFAEADAEVVLYSPVWRPGWVHATVGVSSLSVQQQPLTALLPRAVASCRYLVHVSRR